MQKGIPVVIVDSALKGEPIKDFVCTVSTNNRRAGEMVDDQLGKLLHGRGKVVLFRLKEASASVTQREVNADLLKTRAEMKFATSSHEDEPCGYRGPGRFLEPQI